MQYEEKIKTYERVKRTEDVSIEEKNEKLREIIINVVLFFVAVLISRVIMINKSSPFGVAFLMTILMLGDNRLSVIMGLGVEIGYVINIDSVPNSVMYIVMVPTLVFLVLIIKGRLERKVELTLLLLTSLAMMFVFNLFVSKYPIGVSLGNTALEALEMIPIYLVLEYGVKNLNRIKTKHLFVSEEIVSMSIILALIVAGTWDVGIFGVSLLNILCLLSVIVIGYICGTSIGATTGVAMGVIVGMSTNTIFAYATILGLSGLVAGIFREGGKLLSSISSLIVFCIMKIYISNNGMIEGTQFLIFEAIISIVIFLAIPERFYDILSDELDADKKSSKYEEGYIERVKDVFTEKLNKFSGVLDNISDTLCNLADNEKLDMTTKSSALVENLANRVCNNCDTCKICWGREMMNTYKAFQDLIEGAQCNTLKFPNTLEKKCMKKGALIRNTEDLINSYVLNEMWRSRLAEGRELIANQFQNMSKSVCEIMNEFSEDFNEDRESERKILTMLEKYDVDFDDVFAIRDKSGHLNVQVTCCPCEGRNYCYKSILPLINGCVESKMKIKKDGCKISTDNKKCTAYFEEVPKFEIVTSVSRACKDNQTVYGDNYTYGDTGDGSYSMVISDGMGSGPQAGRESRAVIDLIEKFTDAGFTRNAAINTVNSIMSLKFSEEEKFSTVDMSSVDLYTGTVSFMKVGAVASFIKRGNNIDIIKSKTLPIGVLDDADVEVNERTVRGGDLIVMISDGIIDCDEKQGGKVDWILDYLVRNGSKSIEEISDGLISEAKALAGSKVNDDMTVMISKVRSLK